MLVNREIRLKLKSIVSSVSSAKDYIATSYMYLLFTEVQCTKNSK